ncbi:MAG TPA: hypothetical protein VL860_01395, partial [Planctomycetota bacterium]|nr:hypothetical protein [Planctomycetota bacterium]
MNQEPIATHIDHRRYRRRMPPMWPFLLLGMLAQAVFAVFFLMPGMNPVAHQEDIEQARVEMKEEKKEKLEEVKQDIQDELQKLKQLKDEEDKAKLADELFKEIFNELVDEDIPAEEREAMYEQVKAALNKDLEDAILKIDEFNRKRQEDQLRKAKDAQAGRNSNSETDANGNKNPDGNNENNPADAEGNQT